MPKVALKFGESILVLDMWVAILLFFLINFIIFFTIIYLTQRSSRKKLKKASIENEQIDDFYFRDIPFKDLETAFYVSTYYGITDNLSNFIGAMLLKWICEDKIDVYEIEDKTFIDMRKIFKTEIGFESAIYVRLLACANANRILEENEFKKFFQDSEQIINSLFYKLKKEVEEELLLQGLITKKTNEYGYEEIIPTKALEQKATELQGLKNFLNNFSSIEKKDAIQVHLWDDYLIYAQLFGIADKVENEFKKIYPDYNNLIKIDIAKVAIVNSLAISLRLTIRAFISILSSSNKD